jgi:hypothetical protein
MANVFRASFVFHKDGTLSVDTNISAQLRASAALTLEKVHADVKTAPTGADLILDINLNGTSIWNATQANRVTILATELTGSQTAFDTTAVIADDLLTLDVDQIGSSVAGADVTINLFFKQDVEVS